MNASMNISRWVQQWARLQPDKCAIWFEDREISYSRLQRRVCRAAAWFASRGLGPGQRVAVLLDNCPEFIQVYLACSRMGLILVPFNTRWAGEEIGWAIENCEPAAIICHGKYTEKIKNALGNPLPDSMLIVEISENEAADFEVRSFMDELNGLGDDKAIDTRSFHPVPGESPHVIMYTSGTTGRPKGAILSLRKTFFNCLNAEVFLGLRPDDRMLLSVPLFHSGGLFIQASPTLYKGATLYIQAKFDAAKTYEDIRRHAITKYSAVPTIMKKLMSVDPDLRGDISSLEVCAVGGEKIGDDLMRQCIEAGFPMHQIMGQTETSIILYASGEDLRDHPGTVGKPVFHGQVELLDSSGNPVSPGEIGEIAVTGPTIMSGYWRLPDISKETLRDGWLFTGDLARRDEDGYLYLVDRSRDMYISGGENVYPAEVERVLKTHPSIVDAAVVGIPDPGWGQTGHAFVIPEPDVALSDKEIFALCEGRLARFKWPRKITFREHFPRTALGKVKKKSLINTTDP